MLLARSTAATRRVVRISAHLLSGCASALTVEELFSSSAERGRRVDSALQQLALDPQSAENEPNRTMRQVRSGHLVHVVPTPLAKPYLVATSPSFAAELGLGEAVLSSPEFLRAFSGDISDTALRPWCTPYAVSVFGHPIVAPDPYGTGDAYGDGRAVTLGEFSPRDQGAHPWELQLKGGGSTPFGRGADGRAVLRSSVREFLASECMASLGVPTTRALSLVASATEKVGRAWYPPGYKSSPSPPTSLVEERCAITCRASRSFIRVGHFELYYRRVVRKQGREVEGLVELLLLAAHTLRREFPELVPPDASTATDAADAAAIVTPEAVVAMFREHMRRQVALVVAWLRVGYVQGNMNSDNVLVGGRTLDYGPFGFLERYDPTWNPFTSDPERKFGFSNQAHATQVNLLTFARTLVPLLDGDQSRLAELQSVLSDEFPATLAAEMGAMRRDKLGVLEGNVDEELWVPLETLLSDCGMDFTMTFRLLAKIAEADGASLETDALAQLRTASYDEGAFDAKKQEWVAWLRSWHPRVGGTEGSARMLRASPKFVPREWMLHEAYSAAERGDHSVVETLQRLFADPYAEHGAEDERKYFRTCPPDMRGVAGLAFFS